MISAELSEYSLSKTIQSINGFVCPYLTVHALYTKIFGITTSSNWRYQVEVKAMLAHLFKLAQFFKFNKFYKLRNNFTTHGTVPVYRNLAIDRNRTKHCLKNIIMSAYITAWAPPVNSGWVCVPFQPFFLKFSISEMLVKCSFTTHYGKS